MGKQQLHRGKSEGLYGYATEFNPEEGCVADSLSPTQFFFKSLLIPGVQLRVS